jgi:ADP-ribosyl-[dinitrogen reductase] hydrolase
MKTSVSHPLQIAAIAATGPRAGRVGLTFCPGKYDPHAMSGAWDRNLALDLDEVRQWGAVAIVTLLELNELKELRVERLGEEILRRNMAWHHLPIVDGSVPDENFDKKWGTVGPELRSILRDGGDVLVHCRGGLGRAGTIASRLLIELGMAPETAMARVRAVRPGAIENFAQEQYVRTLAEAKD